MVPPRPVPVEAIRESAMRAANVFAVGVFAFATLSPVSRAAAPAAPVITVGADIKQLQFDWEQVPTSGWYELWFKANDGSPWIKYTQIPAARLARIRIGVSVHLLDWRVAKYHVAACNPSGCTNSADVGVAGLANEAVGYFKPQVTNSNRFGTAVAMSADGHTFAVVNGETFGSTILTATVSVYRKTSATSINGGWRREARLVPSIPQGSTVVTAQLALSGDGNVLALALPQEAWRDGGQTLTQAGAVYTFRREGTTWTQEQRITGESIAGNQFGLLLDLDDGANTMVVGRLRDDAGNFAYGTTDVYLHSDGGWKFQHTVPVGVISGYSDECRGLALSGDGGTFARACIRGAVQMFTIKNGCAVPQGQAEIATPVDFSSAVDLDGGGTRLAVRSDFFNVQVWKLAAGLWVQEGGNLYLGPSAGLNHGLAISRDGKLVASAVADDSPEDSPIYPPLTHGGVRSNSVHVFERKSAGWTLRRILKPTVRNATDGYGISLAFGNLGRALVVGANFDASAATGIGGDSSDTSAVFRGAAWLY
jgi:hypothetical protein